MKRAAGLIQTLKRIGATRYETRDQDRPLTSSLQSLTMAARGITGKVHVLLVLAAFYSVGGCYADEPASVVLKFEIDSDGLFAGETVDMDSLVKAINRRLRSLGKARSLENQQVEVELYGEFDQAELESIKRRIGTMGDLEFRILADSTQPKDRPIIEQAKRVPPSQKEIKIDGNKVAEWMKYADAEFGPVDQEQNGMVKRLAGDVPEALVLIDRSNVTGQYLTAAHKELDERGAPSVQLSFDREGARRIRLLTNQNKLNPALPDVYRRFGIVLDKRLISAPRITTTISDRATISGAAMTERDVEEIIAILNEGYLPHAVRQVDEKHVDK